MRHGGQVLVEQLKSEGVDRVFQVPGESFLAALDGLYESGVDVVNCRQEGGATMMAEADGKMTGRPGVAFVTRGPGATNGSSGIHVAMQDSTPSVTFIGQVGGDMVDREAFQEIDYRRMFASVAKWAGQIDSVDRIPEYVSHAFHTAMSGRPGPVVLALPETMLSATTSAPSVPGSNPAIAEPSAALVERAIAFLEGAERPLVIVGGPGWSAEAVAAVRRFAEASNIPIAASLRCQDYVDNTIPQYVGDMGIAISPVLKKVVLEADVVLVIGSRLGEMTTQGYTLFEVPEPNQTLIHVYPTGDEIGRVYRPDLGIVSAGEPFIKALAAAWTPSENPAWAGWTRSAREAFEAWVTPKETPGAVKLEEVVAHLVKTLPEDAIITNGAGNYSGWVHRYYQFRGWRTQLAPTSGSMGYGLPAAIAAKLRRPQSPVVAFAGDGCFQMTCQEFGTAVQAGAPIVTVVCDNGMYGTIRMHQERSYPGRTSGTGLVNPDFAKWAESYGGFGAHVHDTSEFPDAFQAALKSGRPAILHLHTDPEALSTGLRLSAFATS